MFVATATTPTGAPVSATKTMTTTTNMKNSYNDATTTSTISATTTTETATTATTTTGITATCETSRSAALTSAATRTTITSDPGILCFHHCNVKVFCFTLPHICPNCKAKLDTTDDDANADADEEGEEYEGADEREKAGEEEDDHIRDANVTTSRAVRNRMEGNALPATKVLMPFRLPYPFVRASQYPCAVVLRPTTGDFLNDYNNATDLHIAVTTSTGTVVEFDRHGLRQHRTENMPDWWQCLLVGDVPEPWYDYWDDILLQLCKQITRWSTAAYHEDTHNCYTFVLAFLQALGYDKLSEAAHSKTTFCEKYIVPRTTTAGKYISLYRKLRATSGGVYVHPYASRRHQQPKQLLHHRGKVRGGYIKPPVLIAPASTKKTSKAMGSIASSITPVLCTIEE